MTTLGRPVRVLLVDDDEDDYLLIREMFGEIEEGRAELTWVSRYDDAVAALDLKSFDVYLVDYRLGGKTGFDFMDEAMKKGIHAPLILLTGAGDRSTDLEAMKRGAADYLVKGHFTADQLERSIRFSLKIASDLERIRQREENFRCLFDSASEGMIVHDYGAAILDVNATAGKIFGCPARELIGRDFISLYHPGGRDQLNRCRSAEGEEEIQYEAIALAKDGREIHIEANGKVIWYHGKKVRLTSIRDVTAAKEMELQIRMQDRMASVGLLTSGLAHEIGNPLSVIQGRIHFLAKQVADMEKPTQNVKIIGAQVDRINKLIRSFLNVARGTENCALEAVSVPEVVDDVLGLMTYEFRKRHIEVRNELAPDARVEVRAETGALQQVLLNLFINAVHAMDTGATTGQGHYLKISALDNGGRSELRIEDNGCGIAKENMKNLFKPFFSTKAAGKGTGLGLATCHRIVQGWGGAIEVESEVGRGTEFRISLPSARSKLRPLIGDGSSLPPPARNSYRCGDSSRI